VRVAFAGDDPREDVGALARGLGEALQARGLEPAEAATARLVFNLADSDAPRAHWMRGDLDQYGVTLLATPPGSLDAAASAPSDVLSVTYPALLKTMSNAVIAVDGERLVLVTPEMGVRPLDAGPPAESVLDAVLPLAGARFCIENELSEDLPEEFRTCEALSALADGGRRLAGLGLLPSPVSLDGLLSDADRKLLRAIYGVQQISYGNLSCREPSGGFWMSGRGVDKGRLATVGRDLLLVVGHDRDTGRLRLRVPPGCTEGRVSVDAMEHALIYERWPAVGAIVHVHAWMEGVDSTRQNWPCGTVEIADEVAELIGRQADPTNAVVGLRNHGLTITGPSLSAIFQRIEGRLQREIPPQAAAAASRLAELGLKPGDRVLLPLETNASSVVSLLALLRAGCVPATAPPAHLGQDAGAHARGLEELAARHELEAVLRPDGPAGCVEESATVGPTRLLRLGAGERPPVAAAPAIPPARESDALALVQFSSGTTRSPKGVELTHRAVLANLALCRAADARGVDAVHVSWLPLYHDMGLVGSLLASLSAGHELVLLDPACFVLKPVSWLEALSRHGATSTAAPNFALAVTCERIPDSQLRRRNLDLSRLRSVFNGAEPVRPLTVRRFEERLREHGLRPGTVRPVYGLAEATLIVTAPDEGSPLRTREIDGLEVVSVGRPLGDTEIRVVPPGAPASQALPADSVGEILLRGASLTRGYHRDGEATRATLDAGWLRTGDLGLVDDEGHLHVTGRIKDLLFVAGRNYYAHEIGDVVDELPFARKGHSHALALPQSGGGEELVVLLSPAHGLARRLRETGEALSERLSSLGSPGRRAGRLALFGARALAGLVGGERDPKRLERLTPHLAGDVRKHLQRQLGLSVDRVELVQRLPKTTSGKVLREACRQLALERRAPVR
jgi:acyl-CoA synthetase (AMP-forming)/AMP-acid ligase II